MVLVRTGIPGCKLKERLRILQSQFGDGAEHALFPQHRVGQCGNIAHVYAGAYHRAAPCHPAQSGRDQGTHWRDDPVLCSSRH